MAENNTQPLQRSNSSTARLPTPRDPDEARKAARRSIVSAPGYPYRRRHSVELEEHELCGEQLQSEGEAQVGGVTEEESKSPGRRSDEAVPEFLNLGVQRLRPTKTRSLPPRPDHIEPLVSLEHPESNKRSAATQTQDPKKPARTKRPPQRISRAQNRIIFEILPEEIEPPKRVHTHPGQQHHRPPPSPKPHLTFNSAAPLTLESQHQHRPQHPLLTRSHHHLTRIYNTTKTFFSEAAGHDSAELLLTRRTPRPKGWWWRPKRKVVWVFVGTCVMTVAISLVLFPEAYGIGEGGVSGL